MSQKLLKKVRDTANEAADAAYEAASAALTQAEDAITEANFWRKAVELLEVLVAHKCEGCEYYGDCDGCFDYGLEEDDLEEDFDDEDD